MLLDRVKFQISLLHAWHLRKGSFKGNDPQGWKMQVQERGEGWREREREGNERT